MKCKICNKEVKGRKDKIFCSVRCKNYYHTNLRRVTNMEVVTINKILHRNRSILLEIMGKRKFQIKIKRLVLEKKNFHFTYHTHFHTNKQEKTFFHVYDFAWMEFSNDEILIVRRRKNGNNRNDTYPSPLN